MLDYAYTNIGEMEILEVKPNDFTNRMVSILVDGAREIHLGILCISDHPRVAEDHAVRAKATENRVEQVCREALADLFHLPRDVEHVVEMLNRQSFISSALVPSRILVLVKVLREPLEMIKFQSLGKQA